jgi:hypothetical protein
MVRVRCTFLSVTVAAGVLVVPASCAALPPSSSPPVETGELVLKPGPFEPFPGTALDQPVEFTNDIYGAPCHPLFVVTGNSTTAAGQRPTGTIILWMNRAHSVGGRVFVQPCEIAAPLSMSSTRIEGYVSNEWVEAALDPSPTSPQINTRRLDIAGWSEFSNPSFCANYVAFWSLEENRTMSAIVVDLVRPQRRVATSFGRIDIGESDMGWGVPSAAWSRSCASATFRTEAGDSRVLRTSGGQSK